jgi:hypothetical protein
VVIVDWVIRGTGLPAHLILTVMIPIRTPLSRSSSGWETSHTELSASSDPGAVVAEGGEVLADLRIIRASLRKVHMNRLLMRPQAPQFYHQ